MNHEVDTQIPILHRAHPPPQEAPPLVGLKNHLVVLKFLLIEE